MDERERMERLLILLFDSEATIGERDDAAMDLEEFDDNLALEGLVRKAQDESEDDMVLYSCGESIAQIWIRRNRFDKAIYSSLNGEAQRSLYGIIEELKPDWIQKYQIQAEWRKN